MKLALLLMLSVAAAFGQQKRLACSVITQQDAEAILGPKAAQHAGPGSCAYDAPGQNFILVVILDSSPNVKTQIWLPKQNIGRAGGTVREEPGVYPGAYSTSIRGAQSVYVLKGDTAVSVTVTNDSKGALPDMLDKLRPLAKKIAGRL